MQTYAIYEKKDGNLIWIMYVRARSAEHALRSFVDDFGDNYGKVVVMNAEIYFNKHTSLEISATIA